MEPSEKAKELFNKFLYEMPKYFQGKLGRETAKKQAIISAKEIITDYDNILSDDVGLKFIIDKMDYYEKVVNEIEKI